MKKLLLSFFMLCVGLVQASAQEDRVIEVKAIPVGFGDNSVAMAYYSGGEVFTMTGKSVLSEPGIIYGLGLNPSGCYYSVIYQKARKGTSKIDIYSSTKVDDIVAIPKIKEDVLAAAFSSDGKELVVSDVNGVLHRMETKKFAEVGQYKSDFPVRKLGFSSDMKYLVLSDGAGRLEVRAVESQNVRLAIDIEGIVNDFSFSYDGSFFAVSESDGTVIVYDTRSFNPAQTIRNMGSAKKVFFNKDNKYVIVLTSPDELSIINRFDLSDVQKVALSRPGAVNAASLSSHANDNLWFVYSSGNAIVLSRLNSFFKPNYTKLIEDQLQDKLDAWLKFLPDETLEQYQVRVTDETRAKQAALYEEEIATTLAAEMLENSTVKLGSYNQENGLLSLDFDSMPSIYITIPTNEISEFTAVDDLEFKNPRYGLTEDDGFELVYVEVVNRNTGSSYVFDNRERKSLEYMKTEDSFVSLDLIQMANTNEVKLQSIKEEVVAKAMQTNSISHHTQISVNTNLKPDYDAEGKKILNYHVDFTYDVEKSFSAEEDFGPGKYHTEESGAATAMVEIIKQAFETEFAQYVKEGKTLKVSITGMADHMPIARKISYSEEYGRFDNEQVYKNNEPTTISLTKEDGITSNDQLALVRAAGVKDYLEKNIPSLSIMKKNYDYRINVSDSEGGQFRRITVNFVFVDAF